MRAERLEERTDAKVAKASTNVPKPVASDEIVAQSVPRGSIAPQFATASQHRLRGAGEARGSGPHRPEGPRRSQLRSTSTPSRSATSRHRRRASVPAAPKTTCPSDVASDQPPSLATSLNACPARAASADAAGGIDLLSCIRLSRSFVGLAQLRARSLERSND